MCLIRRPKSIGWWIIWSPNCGGTRSGARRLRRGRETSAERGGTSPIAARSGDLRRAGCAVRGSRETCAERGACCAAVGRPPPSAGSRRQLSRQAATFNSPGRQPGEDVAKRMAKRRRGDTRRSSNARRLRRGRETSAERSGTRQLRRGREACAKRGALRRGPETCAERGACCAAVGTHLRRARGVATNSAAKRRHTIAPGVSPGETSPSEWSSPVGAIHGARRMHIANCGEVGRPAPSAVRVARQSGDFRRARCVAARLLSRCVGQLHFQAIGIVEVNPPVGPHHARFDPHCFQFSFAFVDIVIIDRITIVVHRRLVTAKQC